MLGQKETRIIEASGVDGGPIKVQDVDKDVASFKALVDNLVDAGVKLKSSS